MHAMKDLYPSRVSDTPSLSARKDPVVHGDAAAGPLAADDLAAYQRDGFFAFPGFFDAGEVGRFRAAMDRLSTWGARVEDERVIREPGAEAVRSVFAVHDHDPFFATLVRDPRLVDIARQLLGSEVYVHQSRINFKAGFTGKEFYWHSDFETWHVEDGMPRMRALSMSIALSANTPDNGPLMLVPGSHATYVACVGRTPDGHYKDSLRKQELGTPDRASLTTLVEAGGIATPTGPAGSLIVFECNTMHGSNGNITPLPRSNAFFVYNSVENALVAPFGGTAPRPGFVASRDAVPLRKAA